MCWRNCPFISQHGVLPMEYIYIYGMRYIYIWHILIVELWFTWSFCKCGTLSFHITLKRSSNKYEAPRDRHNEGTSNGWSRSWYKQTISLINQAISLINRVLFTCIFTQQAAHKYVLQILSFYGKCIITWDVVNSVSVWSWRQVCSIHIMLCRYRIYSGSRVPTVTLGFFHFNP